MKINGHDYTTQEVFEALEAKGYEIVGHVNTYEDETFPGGIEYIDVVDYCAIKEGEEPCEKNMWQNVAIKEFQKEFVKPKLV